MNVDRDSASARASLEPGVVDAHEIAVDERATPDGASSPAIAQILERYLRGEISAPVTLMQLLIETEDAQATRVAVSSVARDNAGRDQNDQVQQRAFELERAMVANAAGCERIAAMLRADVDSPRPAQSVEEGIAFCERLFDWSVQQSEEASVALYSLGNPQLLEQATAEIVSALRQWGAVTSQTSVLDIGCGIGRLLAALAPEVRRATGIDISAEMVKAARRRCVAFGNVDVLKSDGRGLGELANEAFDVVLAVDSFPYLRQSGYPLVERFFAESARVLKPGGQFVILNYSYSEDDEADAREVASLAAANGLEGQLTGERPFQLWDAVAFRLIKPR